MTDAKSDSEEQTVVLKRHTPAVTDLKVRRAARTHGQPRRETVIVSQRCRPYDFLLGHNHSVSVAITSGIASRSGTACTGAAGAAVADAQLVRKRRDHSAGRPLRRR